MSYVVRSYYANLQVILLFGGPGRTGLHNLIFKKHIFFLIWCFCFLPFNYIVYFTVVNFKYYCPLAAVANTFPCLWDSKGILILILSWRTLRPMGMKQKE